MERGDDAEVAAAAAQAPEQIGVLGFGRDDLAAVGGDDLGLHEVVAGEAELALEPTAAAAEREATDAGGRDPAAGDCQAVFLRGGVDLSPPRPALDAGDALVRVDVDAVHGAEVDADTGVDDGRAGDAVAAAVDGECDVLLAGDIYRGGDVAGAGAPGDEGGLAVDHRVEHRTGVVVRGVAGMDELTLEAGDLEVCGAIANVSHACPRLPFPESNERSVFHVGGGPGSVLVEHPARISDAG